MSLNLRSIQSNFKHPVLLVTTLGLLSACGQVPNLKANEEASVQILSNQLLLTLSEVEIRNPYSSGADANCTFDKAIVNIASGTEIRKIITPGLVTSVTCASTKNQFTVTIKTKNGGEVSQSQPKDAQLISGREFGQSILSALWATEQLNPTTNGLDTGCFIDASLLTIISNQSQKTLPLKPEISSVTCESTVTEFTVNLKTKNGQKLTQKMNKPEDYFASLIARDILNAMEYAEKQNPHSNGWNVYCVYANSVVTVTSDMTSIQISTPAPITDVTCASNPNQFTVAVTTMASGFPNYYYRNKTNP